MAKIQPVHLDEVGGGQASPQGKESGPAPRNATVRGRGEGCFRLGPFCARSGETIHENSCHWCLDMIYREDESRIRELHLRENFAWLKRFTLSLLKQHPGKDSIAMRRRACGWSHEFLMEALVGATV